MTLKKGTAMICIYEGEAGSREVTFDINGCSDDEIMEGMKEGRRAIKILNSIIWAIEIIKEPKKHLLEALFKFLWSMGPKHGM